jgi:nucleoprotein TPR
MKQKEITLLEKQAIDMGRQINGLLSHIAHLEDPSLPDEHTDEPPTEGVLDSDAFISSNLVLFKNLRHLREQNQVLLKLSRKLGAQLEERGNQAEESEIMTEARQLIEGLQKELLSASAKAESYVRERDMFKSMLGRSQSNVGSGATTISLGPGAPDYHKMYDEEHVMLEELKQKWNKELANLRDDIEKGRVERDKLNQTINQLKSQVDFHKRMTGIFRVNTVLLMQPLDVEQLAKDAKAGQAQEIMGLTSRNRDLQVLLRETESRISQVTGTLAEKSAQMGALVSELNLLKSEKTIMKVGPRDTVVPSSFLNVSQSREDRLEHEHRTLVADRVRNNQTLEDYRKMKDELATMWEQSKTALEAERTKLLSEL